MYKLIKNNFGEYLSVSLISENKTIPFDPTNTDYQDYLKWVAEGNNPEPADE